MIALVEMSMYKMFSLCMMYLKSVNNNEYHYIFNDLMFGLFLVERRLLLNLRNIKNNLQPNLPQLRLQSTIAGKN